MAGTVIRVVPKTFFTFSGVPGNAPGPTTLWLARKIDVSPWTELTAVIRLHSGTSITGGAWTSPPTISAYADGFTDDDEKCDQPGKSHLLRKESHGALKPEPSVPSQ